MSRAIASKIGDITENKPNGRT